MNKLIAILFSIMISLNAYSVQKSDFEGKTHTYFLTIGNIDYTIERQFFKNGKLKNVEKGSDGEIWVGMESRWWVKNNNLYIQFQGLNTPTLFRFDFKNNKVIYDTYDGIRREMAILKIDGVNLKN